MNCKILFFVFVVVFFASISLVCAGDNSTGYGYVVNDTVKDLDTVNVSALEDGHFNTTFSDGSNGYCLEYGEQEAVKGDVFKKVSTDFYDCSNSLKLYFVDYTNHALEDKVRTQHMIWHFTDGFDGWRLNYTIINEIKDSTKVISDVYVQKLNSTHERVWFFNVLLSLYENHQDYFNYRFYDRLINQTDDNCSMVNCTVTGNVSNITYNDSVCVILNLWFNDTVFRGDVEQSSIVCVENVTGHPIGVVFIILFLIFLYFIDRRY